MVQGTMQQDSLQEAVHHRAYLTSKKDIWWVGGRAGGSVGEWVGE